MAGETGQWRLPALRVASAGEAVAACAAAGARPFWLVSPRDAAGWLGPRLFLAWVAAAREAAPHAAPRALLDAGQDPGHALAALAAGCADVALDPAVPAFGQVAAAFAARDAALHAGLPQALDLSRLDLRRAGGRARLAAWLDAGSAVTP